MGHLPAPRHQVAAPVARVTSRPQRCLARQWPASLLYSDGSGTHTNHPMHQRLFVVCACLTCAAVTPSPSLAVRRRRLSCGNCFDPLAMPKHSKNATAAPFISNNERKKFSWGSRSVRLGKDSLLPFAHCYLCTQWAVEPLVSPSGHMYCKECIYKNLLSQRAALKKQKAAWKAQQAADAAETSEAALAAAAADVQSFIDQETNPTAQLARGRGEAGSVLGVGTSTVQAAAFASPEEGAAAQGRTLRERAEAEAAQRTAAVQQAHARVDLRDEDVKRREVAATSFWVPSFAPESAPTRVKRPAARPSSPITGAPLRAKDLLPVKFHVEDKDEAAAGGKGRFCCAITRKSITHQPAVLLRPSAAVVLASAFEAAVKGGMVDPINGASLGPGDVVPLASEGSGFAARGSGKLVAKSWRPGKA